MAPDLVQRINTVRVLWAALTASVLMFVGVAAFAPHPDRPADMIMVYAMIGAACATLTVRTVLLRQMQAQMFRNVSLELTEEPDPSKDSMFYDAPPTRKVVANPKQARGVAFGRLQTLFILAMALSEAIALYGLALTQLGYPLSFAVPFFVVTLALNALRFPTVDAFLGPLERQLSARIPRDR